MRDKTPLSLIVIDIDYFKPFNDNYGHTAGDECLKKIAKTLASSMARSVDLIARYGGEEFVCILPKTEASGMVQVGNQLRDNINALQFPHEYSKVAQHITISLGGASIIPSQESSQFLLVGQADSMLYKAKDGGRNRLEIEDQNPLNSDELLNSSVERFKDDIWEKLTEIKVPHLHDQHCKLVEYLIDIFEMMGKFKVKKFHYTEKTQLTTTLSNIQDYIALHLKDEEAFLSKINFPDLENHRAAHKKFTDKFLKIRGQVEEHGLHYVDDLFFFVYSWLFEHINSQDTKYSEFYVKISLASDFPPKGYI